MSTIGWGLLLVGCLGCGTAEYKKRLDQTVSRLREEAGGQTVAASWSHGEMALGDAGIVVHLPVVVGPQPLQSEGDSKADPRQLAIASVGAIQPVAVYQGFVADSSGGLIHFQCFVAHPPADPSAEIQQQLQALFPGATVEWTSVECQAGDSPTTTWQEIEIAGVNQDVYYVSKSEEASFISMSCKVAIYLRQIEGQWVAIAWRVPTDIEASIGVIDEFGLELWAKRTAGGVTPQ